ncbi:uncharacterized protein G2W53_019901 [Senna tora]|uniref:Uncharacterized protein n=1 Tax=Senna tora TaxID=362788 RepID=A0A834TUX6_9FABA|nr:uncharacterized protein G2W53_019901 [Senna tora]
MDMGEKGELYDTASLNANVDRNGNSVARKRIRVQHPSQT